MNHGPSLNKLPPTKSQVTVGKPRGGAYSVNLCGISQPVFVAYLWPNSRGDRYDVSFQGETIVRRSRDPEHDLARALLSRGHKGFVTIHDGRTRTARTTVHIDMAAQLRRTDEARDGLRARKWSQNPDAELYTAEATLPRACMPPGGYTMNGKIFRAPLPLPRKAV